MSVFWKSYEIIFPSSKMHYRILGKVVRICRQIKIFLLFKKVSANCYWHNSWSLSRLWLNVTYNNFIRKYRWIYYNNSNNKDYIRLIRAKSRIASIYCEKDVIPLVFFRACGALLGECYIRIEIAGVFTRTSRAVVLDNFILAVS